MAAVSFGIGSTPIGVSTPLNPAFRAEPGTEGLIVGLHGYGGDEHQLVTLLDLDLPVVVDRTQASAINAFASTVLGLTGRGGPQELNRLDSDAHTPR